MPGRVSSVNHHKERDTNSKQMRRRLAPILPPNLQPRQARRLLRNTRECCVGTERRQLPERELRPNGMAAGCQFCGREERSRT